MTDESRADAALTDEERAQELIDQLRRLHVEDLAYDMAVSLVQVGYQKMGLTEETRELRSLGDARLAIDLLRALLPVLRAESSKLPLADLEGTLAQMQLNYVRATQLEEAGPRDERPAGEARGAGEAGVGRDEAPADDARERTAETPEPAKEPEPAEEAASAAPKKPAGKRPSAKKPAGKKPAAKKSATGTGAAGTRPKKAAGKDQADEKGEAGDT
jgi:hypothetical protein